MRALCLMLLLLALVTPSTAPVHGRGAKMASKEELLEVVDNWLYEFDEDEDGQVSLSEMSGLLVQLRAQTSMPGKGAQALTPQVLMKQADGDGDGHASRVELVDLLKRMKGFDAGHVSRDAAIKPSGSVDATEQTYGVSHAERMRGKARSRKGKRSKRTKDEM